MLHPPTGRPRRLHWVALAGVAVSGMGLVAATAEWYVRRIVPIDWTQEYRVPHPVRGWALEPNARYTTYVPEPIRVAYNSEGWRDRERPKPAGSTPRVAVLGDSFVEACSVQHDEAFSSRLERLAAASGRPIEVLNFGVGGYGTLQEYLTFTEAARQYGPRLVLLGFYLGNDVRNNDLALESVVNTGQVKVTSRPFLDPNRNAESDWALLPVDFERATREYGAERARRERWPLRDARKSVLLRLAGRTVRRVRRTWSEPAAIPDARPSGGEVGIGIGIDQGDLARFGVHFCDEPSAITRAWTITARILARLRDAAASSGALLVIFIVPAVEEVDPDARRIALSDADDASQICLDQAPGYARLASLLADLDIPAIDLLPAFRMAIQDGRPDLFRREGHWGPAGHTLAAEQVLTAIDEGNWLAR